MCPPFFFNFIIVNWLKYFYQPFITMNYPEMEKTILNSTDYKHYFEKSVGYEKYIQNFEAELKSGEEGPYTKYLPQNFSRQSRLDRKLKLKDDLLVVIKKLDQKQNWLVITEHWCGDASQINPVINKVAEASEGNIMLRFIYRDESPALMNAHLTDGKSRSIPMLLQLDESFNFIKSYGPRPKEAQFLVKKLISKGQAYDIPLHTWYAKDKQQSIQSDIINFLSNFN